MHIFLRSDSADYDNENTWIWIFRRAIRLCDPVDLCRVAVSSSTYYSVQFNVKAGYNDTLSITVDGVTNRATVAEGFYSASDLAGVLDSALPEITIALEPNQ